MSLERPTPKQTGDTHRPINDHAVLMVGIQPDNKHGYIAIGLNGEVITVDGGAGWTQRRGVADGQPFNIADASGSQAVTLAPAAGQSLVIDDLHISVEDALTVTLLEETSNHVIIGPLYLPANYAGQITFRGKVKLVADKKLLVVASGAGNITVLALYHEEAP